MMKIVKTSFVISGLTVGYGYLKGFIGPNTKIKSFDDVECRTKLASYLIDENEKKKQVEPKSRDDIIKQMENDNYDIVIIGGGSAGSGVFSAAVRRGLKTCLIEKRDFASGTSSKSTKIAHGGIRYLEDVFSFKNPVDKLALVFEALSERDKILKSGAFINNQVEVKITSKEVYMSAYYYAGCLIYHYLYLISNLVKGTFMDSIISHPTITIDKRGYHVSLFEGQMIDCRQNVLTLLSDKNNNSAIGNYIEFIDFIEDKANNEYTGVIVRDTITGKKFTIKCASIANCTGVMADLNINAEDKNFNKMIKASKGTHIVVNKSIFPKEVHTHGLMIPKTSDGRILFILPYQGKYLVGTTDEIAEKSELIESENKEVDWIVKEVSEFFNIDQNTLKSNITSTWSGERPLVSLPTDNSSPTTDLRSVSRKHVIYRGKSNLFTLMGGKWTSYLRMGEDTISEMVDNIPKLSSFRGISKLPPLKLPGSINIENLSYKEERYMFKCLVDILSAAFPSLPDYYIKKVISLYGTNAYYLLEKGKRENKNKPISKELNKFYMILESEVIYCIENEHVLKPNDFLLRRRSIGFLNSEVSKQYIPYVTKIMGEKLNWSADKIAREEREANELLKYMV